MASFVTPSYSFNTQCMIALVFIGVFLKDNGVNKIKRLKNNALQIALLSTPLVIALIGLIYTNDLNQGLKIITNQVPFLLISLTFLTTKYTDNQLHYSLKAFSFSVFIYCLMSFIFAYYLKINQLGNYFYYEQYGYFFDKHTTYFALFINLAITYLSYLIIKNLRNKINLLYLFIIAFLGIQLYFLSVRIAIVSLIINLIFIVFSLKSKVKYVSILGLIGCSYIIFSLPNFKKRFSPSMTEIGSMDGLNFRKEHWISVLKTIQHNGIFFGGGTGSDRSFLFEEFKNRKLTSAYLEEYNAHNQYLELIMDYGLFGFSIFICLLIYLYYYQIKHRNLLALLILNTFIIFFTTESLLVRHSGIMLFAILSTLIMNQTINNSHFGKNKTF